MPIVLPLVALDALVVALWCIAVALAIALVLDKISSILASVPWAGGYLSGAVKSMAQKISNAAGTLEGGIDSLIGAAWHALSRYMDHLWSQFAQHSAIFLQLAHLVGSLVHADGAIRYLVKSITGVAHGVATAVRTLEKEYKGIEHRVKTIEREIGAGIGNDVRTAVKALEKEFTGLEKRVIPDLRQGIKTAEGEVTDLENFIKAIPGTRYLDWAAGVVIAALGLGVFNLFKCPTFLGKTLGRGCGLWNALEDIFGLFVDAILFADLCQVPAWINEIFAPIEGVVVGLISDAANAACAQPPAGYVWPTATPAQLPPAQSIGSLPS